VREFLAGKFGFHLRLMLANKDSVDEHAPAFRLIMDFLNDHISRLIRLLTLRPRHLVVSLPLSMPRTPKGHKRPADVIRNAVTIMRNATGEIEESGTTEDGRSKAAVELGRKGGAARAKSMTRKRRVEIAKKAARSRWVKVEKP
jgi:hypothetical protein